ncbi:cytochrome c-type biogenesis protein CcsB [Antricoccus suffuscus]|uniref:Cytochrome c-type biogenesis protein CcsB n=1 Tax=Antricoccus suffuscus TaxID=1629062 RepID=A0A2T0ZS20_9ACTN|nr:c-type cytochrome biogenesis protein CcsB [Antricoccus suffuscus]PRZ39084.1 cytochrome c-type biogenesis protein CcsB [Antricoccus suffuscus]
MAVDLALANISDHLYSGALVGYSAGIVMLCGDFAFGKSGRKKEAKEAALLAAAEEKQPALVGASVGSTLQPPAGSEDRADSSAVPAPGEGADRTARIGAKMGLFGVVFTLLGLIAQIASAAVRGIAIGRLPWGNMFEFASIISIVAVATYLITLGRKPRLRFIGLFVLVPVVIILVLAGLDLYVEAAPVVAALRSYWLAIHVTAASIATGIFFVSTVASALYLVKERHERKEAAAGMRLPSRVAGSLPSSTALDRLAARTVTFAFPIWTFAIICGAIWAEAAWGRYWGWDPKETWAFISWVAYAGYLHARATAGWKGRKAAYLNLLAAVTMLFNFVVVNTVVSGLHSYSGLS